MPLRTSVRKGSPRRYEGRLKHVTDLLLVVAAFILGFTATYSQTMYRLPVRTIVAINAVTVPAAVALVAYVVTNNWLYSITFAALFSLAVIPVIGRLASARAKRLAGRR
jgi:hypothetical protein